MNRGSFEGDLGVVLSSEYDADGFIGIGCDHYGEKRAGIEPAELHHTLGFWSRPRDPDVDDQGNVKPGAGCNVFISWEGSVPHVVLATDPRAVQKLPRHQKGGSGFYGDTGKGELPYQVFDGDNGSWTLRVPYAFSGKTATKAMTVTVDVTAESIEIRHGDGMSVKLASGQIVVNGSTVIGAASGGDAIAKSTPTLDVLTNLAAAVQTLAAPGGIIAPTSGGPCTFGPAVAPALAALGASLSAATTTLPATRALVT